MTADRLRAHHLADLLATQPLVLAQDQREPVAVRHAVEHALDGDARLLADGGPLRIVDGRADQQMVVLRPLPGQPAQPLAAAQHVQAGVGGDAVQPGRDIEVVARASQRPVGFDEAVLREVVGVVGVAHHAVDEGVDLALVALEDGLEGGLVARLRPLDPRGLVSCHDSQPFQGAPSHL